MSGEGSCQGDSGGPLFIFNDDPNDPFFTQVAIVSGGKPSSSPCSTSSPGIYTRIDDPEVFAWIQEIAFGRKPEGVDNSGTDASDTGNDYVIFAFYRYKIYFVLSLLFLICCFYFSVKTPHFNWYSIK